MSAPPGAPPIAAASLWLTFDQAAEAALETLREFHDPAGRSPPFRPHLTLLGSCLAPDDPAAAEVVTTLAKGLTAFELRLAGLPVTTAHFYRALALPIAITAVLASLRHAAEHLLGKHPERFAPHVSLLYGGRPRRVAGPQQLRALPPLRVVALELVDTTRELPDWTSLVRAPLREA